MKDIREYNCKTSGFAGYAGILCLHFFEPRARHPALPCLLQLPLRSSVVFLYLYGTEYILVYAREYDYE